MFRQIHWTMFAFALAASSFATPAVGQAPPSLEAVLSVNNLAQLNVTNAMDAVKTLRPLWLRQRGSPGSPGNRFPVRVYLDGLPLGTLDELETIHIDLVVSIQHVGGLQAVQRWGPGHAGGVIHVRTR